MTRLEDPSTMEDTVGVLRHPTFHTGKAIKDKDIVYILHSRECVSSGIDLRECKFSLALDKGILDKLWEDYNDIPVLLGIMKERLVPVAKLNEDMECIGF